MWCVFKLFVVGQGVSQVLPPEVTSNPVTYNLCHETAKATCLKHQGFCLQQIRSPVVLLFCNQLKISSCIATNSLCFDCLISTVDISFKTSLIYIWNLYFYWLLQNFKLHWIKTVVLHFNYFYYMEFCGVKEFLFS